jgi:hypothetical protein
MRGRDVLGRRSGAVGDGEPACKPDSSGVVEDVEPAFVAGAVTRYSGSSEVSPCQPVATCPED